MKLINAMWYVLNAKDTVLTICLDFRYFCTAVLKSVEIVSLLLLWFWFLQVDCVNYSAQEVIISSVCRICSLSIKAIWTIKLEIYLILMDNSTGAVISIQIINTFLQSTCMQCEAWSRSWGTDWANTARSDKYYYYAIHDLTSTKIMKMSKCSYCWVIPHYDKLNIHLSKINMVVDTVYLCVQLWWCTASIAVIDLI
jgi:hypothetical protein